MPEKQEERVALGRNRIKPFRVPAPIRDLSCPAWQLNRGQTELKSVPKSRVNIHPKRSPFQGQVQVDGRALSFELTKIRAVVMKRAGFIGKP